MKIKKYEGLTHSLLRYLRCIYLLSQNRKVVRIKEIAKRSGVTTSAATQAVQELARRGYVVHEHYGFVELTPKGEEVAKEIFSLSRFFIDFFVEYLNVPENIAEEDVCKMLHYFHSETIEKIYKLIREIKRKGALVEIG